MTDKQLHAGDDKSATTPPHQIEAQALARQLGVDPARGLSTAQAATRLQEHGPNRLPGPVPRSMAALLLAQFRDFMIGILLAAALVSGLVGEWVDMLVIVVIVVLNALIGVAQAWRAERAMAALRLLAQAQATVMRDGMTSTLDAQALVPGDIVLLDAGCQVPADLRLLEVVQLRVDESVLTGESVTVPKVSDVLAEDAPTLGDRLNLVYKGTSVTQGRGRGVVLATGMSTELGKLASLLAQERERHTPLQKRLAALGQRMAWAVMFICALVFAVGVLRGEAPLHMILVAVSLAVAAIPEALPAVVTVLLALGAHKMVAVHVLVKRLSAVETLGSVSIICTDKTGTLTQNRMHVEHITTADGQDHDLKGWRPDVQGHELLRAVTLCNNAQPSATGSWQGDPTETALVDAAHSLGLSKLALDDAHPRAHEHAFDASHKRMSTYHPAPSGYVLYTKGAPEAVIPLCHEVWSPSAPLPLHAAQWLERADAMAQSGLRVLAVARMALPTLPDDPNPAVASKGQLQLLGVEALPQRALDQQRAPAGPGDRQRDHREQAAAGAGVGGQVDAQLHVRARAADALERASAQAQQAREAVLGGERLGDQQVQAVVTERDHRRECTREQRDRPHDRPGRSGRIVITADRRPDEEEEPGNEVERRVHPHERADHRHGRGPMRAEDASIAHRDAPAPCAESITRRPSRLPAPRCSQPARPRRPGRRARELQAGRRRGARRRPSPRAAATRTSSTATATERLEPGVTRCSRSSTPSTGPAAKRRAMATHHMFQFCV